jgi:thiol-disulfide isomerase/thioredoxin
MRSIKLLIVLVMAFNHSVLAAGNHVDSLVKRSFLPPNKNKSQESLLLKPAPKLELYGWNNGVRASTKVKIVVVDFWTTWCAPCLGSLIVNRQLSAKYNAKGVVFIGACVNERGKGSMSKILKDFRIDFPVARVTAHSASLWRVHGYPSLGIVDRKGILRAINIKPSCMESILDALIAEQPY